MQPDYYLVILVLNIHGNCCAIWQPQWMSPCKSRRNHHDQYLRFELVTYHPVRSSVPAFSTSFQYSLSSLPEASPHDLCGRLPPPHLYLRNQLTIISTANDASCMFDSSSLTWSIFMLPCFHGNRMGGTLSPSLQLSHGVLLQLLSFEDSVVRDHVRLVCLSNQQQSRWGYVTVAAPAGSR